MRRVIMAVAVLGVALIVQLTAINGLRLPGGGVPDLVLAVVAALGLASGPAAGAVIGFAAGLALDLAPPGTGVLGTYALALCLVGWACGKLRGTLARSALLPIIIAAAAVVAGELLVAGLGLALNPAQVTWSAVRQVLPSTAFYDVAVSPFVLYLVLLVCARLGQEPSSLAPESAGQARLRQAAAAGAPGGVVLLGLGGWLSGPPRSRRERRAAERRLPRMGVARPGDGWVGSSAASRGTLSGHALSGQAFRGELYGGMAGAGRAAGAPHGRGVARLRSGVAGSAAGGQAARAPSGRPVHLRLAGGRKGDGTVGRLLGGGFGGGLLPRGRVRVGTGLSSQALASQGRRRSRRGGGFRPSAMPGGSSSFVATGSVPRRRARRGDGVVGGGLLTSTGTGLRPAAPRFRVRPGRTSAAVIAASGAAGPRRAGPPARLRMRGRRGDAIVGGSVLARGRRPATPRFRSQPLAGGRSLNGKRPRFGYHRWPGLSLLARYRSRSHRWRTSGKRSGGRL
jgi:rod shape-determining protein MreD